MKYEKDGVVVELHIGQVKKYVAHGWTPFDTPVAAEEEVIRLKPTVKTRGTAKSSDDITTQGDE